MRKIFLLSILVIFGINGYSQKIVSVSNPLEEYFQKNYDSTIFLYKSNSVEPFIYIISKKGNKLYNYRYIYTTYEDLGLSYNEYEVGPLNKELKDVFTSRLEKFKKTKPSINQYFRFYNTDSISNLRIDYYGKKNGKGEITNPLWLILQNLNIWNLVDESNEEYRKSNNSISFNKSGKKDIFVLITKGQVKKLEYLELDRPFNEKEERRKKVSEIIERIWMNLTRIG